MNYIESDLEKTKALQVEILEEVDIFCKENNIEYFLFAGTLLGAIRHKGYIPWDDDIDICMRRKEYEIFIQKFSSKKTKLFTASRCKNYYYPFAKISMVGTKTIESIEYAKDLGINIDVFPIDNIPNGTKKQKKYFKKIISQRTMLGHIISSKRAFGVKKLLFFLYFLFKGFPSAKKCIDLLNKNASSYENESTHLVGLTIWDFNLKNAFSSDCLDEKTTVTFEGLSFPAPKGYDSLLKKLYGDYMVLPPESERKTHHFRKDYIAVEENY